MSCTFCGVKVNFGELSRKLRQTAQLMIGLPDYDAYIAHISVKHPEQEPMNKEEFFKNRQINRYPNSSGGGFRCC